MTRGPKAGHEKRGTGHKVMRRILTSLILVVFVIWLLPLGIFIKPAQEKMACNGQRAVCLCTNLLKKAQAKGFVASTVVRNTSSQKEFSSGGASHYFTLALRSVLMKPTAQFVVETDDSPSTVAFVNLPDPVPKV